jgi:GNAT superfamily N-acetyltransferase
MAEWTGPNGYVVSDDEGRLDVAFVHRWLSTQSYWARGRPREVTDRALEHSLNLGLYSDDGAPAGFCRWVTDGATFGWLCDVFVDEAHRGHGLGIFLVQTAVEHPMVAGLRFLLGTKDAHDLYRKFGFAELAVPGRMMEVKPPPPAVDA